ncbi:MAG TPA: type II toxin-antitoxin system RelE/ParE family toxin [Hyphomicrobiales bacterium]|nr:type II toxin-antitoxin system RelE/ParE family toxin [Hyphomicrobiales bacterium]
MPEQRRQAAAMALRFTKAADTDIVHMMLEGIERFGLSQADVYADGLKAACRAIEDNPEIVRLRTEFTPQVRIYRYRSHIIVYRTDEEGVLVIRVRHGREDWSNDPIGDS